MTALRRATPAPSPRGTNFSGLYIDVTNGRTFHAAGAYDAANGIEPEGNGDLMGLRSRLEKMLRGKISDEDMIQLDQLWKNELPNDNDTLGSLKMFLKAKGFNDQDIQKACELADGATATDMLPRNSLEGGFGGRFSERELGRFPEASKIGSEPEMRDLGDDRRPAMDARLRMRRAAANTRTLESLDKKFGTNRIGHA